METPILDASSGWRWHYMISATLVLILGWSIRANSSVLPPLIGAYAPDTLWALLVFLLVAAMRPSTTTWRIAVIALAFACGIEISQLYQAPWINAIRATRLGGLVLGHGFLWSDLICYTVGIGFGAVIDQGLRRGQDRAVSMRVSKHSV